MKNSQRLMSRWIAATTIAASVTVSVAAQKPNIIVILADDLGYQDVGFTGCTEFETPNIDRLARGGVEFLNGYASHPYCGPSRAGLVSGRYQHRFGFEKNPAYAPVDEIAGLPASEITIAKRLKKGGYTTGAIGKWHLGSSPIHHPLKRGFDYFFGMLSGGHDYFASNSMRPDLDYSSPLVDNKKYANVEGYLTDQLTDKALEFIDQSKEKPFFLYLAYNAPHSPWQAPKESIDALEHIKNPKRRAYGAMVVEMDNGIGRVLDCLEEGGLVDDTLIFFLSDNGGPRGGEVTDNGSFRGSKGSMYEGGVHVPFVAYWPGTIPAGSTFSYPVISLDIAATAAALAGVQKGNLEGTNLFPYMTGTKTDAPHENIFFRGSNGVSWSVINKDGLKLMKPSWNVAQLEHYNLAADGSEENNINTPEHAREVKQLQKDWNAWNEGNVDYTFLGEPDHRKKLKTFYADQLD